MTAVPLPLLPAGPPVHPALAGFHPGGRRVVPAPLPRRARPRPRREGWPHIAAGHDTLIAAPTGSGKTLAGFLVCIDRLYRAHEPGDDVDGVTRVVYVSPLKALAVDIAENLERPLAEIAAVAAELGLDAPDIRVAVRTGDTTSSERAAMLRRPPSFVVTTPESLYLLVTSASGRDAAAHGRDRHRRRDPRRRARQARRAPRAHARAARGALRRGARPRRAVGHAAPDRDRRRACSSATARCPRSSTPATSATSTSRSSCPTASSKRSPRPSRWPTCSTASPTLVGEHRTTLVFVNTRRLAERLAHQLGERLGDDVVAAHHGSLSKERRHRVETRLRAGDLQALVATASLELGIDIGPVELVCQIGSPRSIATFLQRVGRSNHSRAGTPEGPPLPADPRRAGRVRRAARRGARRPPRRDPARRACPLDIARPADRRRGRRAGVAHRRPLRRSCAGPRRTPSSTRDAVRRGRRARAPTASRPAGARAARTCTTTRSTASCAAARARGSPRSRRAARSPRPATTASSPSPTTRSSAPSTRTGRSSRWRATSSCSAPTRGRSAGSRPAWCACATPATPPPTVPFWMGEAPARTAELSAEVSELRARGRRASSPPATPTAPAQWLMRGRRASTPTRRR